jgi:hypothetical protein
VAAFGRDGQVLCQGQYSAFPKTAWLCLGMAGLLLAAGVKLMVVDLAPSIALYPMLGALPFVAWAAGCYAWVGTFELDETRLRGQRRTGASFELLREQVERVELVGSRKMDSLGVKLVLFTGPPLVLWRVRPESAIVVLERCARPR